MKADGTIEYGHVELIIKCQCGSRVIVLLPLHTNAAPKSQELADGVAVTTDVDKAVVCSWCGRYLTVETNGEARWSIKRVE